MNEHRREISPFWRGFFDGWTKTLQFIGTVGGCTFFVMTIAEGLRQWLTP